MLLTDQKGRAGEFGGLLREEGASTRAPLNTRKNRSFEFCKRLRQRQLPECSIMDISNRYVVVKGPPRGDAHFYGEWLLAAAKAESLWKRALRDQVFHNQVDRVLVSHFPDFEITAIRTVMWVAENQSQFLLKIDSIDGDDFTIMVGMRFFIRRHGFYQISSPRRVTEANVRAAVLKYAKTEDKAHMLHPEDLVVTIPIAASDGGSRALKRIRKMLRRYTNSMEITCQIGA
jgi:hypothetical protein